jgi:hypothetical protein
VEDKGCAGMASEKLTALKVERARAPGLLNDGKGLNLRIAAGKGGLTPSQHS